MNLFALTSGYVAAVNPMQTITIRVSTGPGAQNSDGTYPSPGYATPGSITASIGGVLTASAGGTTLTVTGVSQGSLQSGDEVTGTDGTNSLLPDTTIIEQLTGTPGGDGTYQLSQAPASGILNSCTVTAASTVLNVTAVAQGTLQVGQTLSDLTSALLPGTDITELLTGTGGAGLYELSQQQTVAAETMTTALLVTAQIQAMTTRDIRQAQGLNLQGTLRSVYLSGTLNGAVRVELKGGDLLAFPDGSIWLVTLVPEPWGLTAGWTKVTITLQNGS